MSLCIIYVGNRGEKTQREEAAGDEPATRVTVNNQQRDEDEGTTRHENQKKLHVEG